GGGRTRRRQGPDGIGGEVGPDGRAPPGQPGDGGRSHLAAVPRRQELQHDLARRGTAGAADDARLDADEGALVDGTGEAVARRPPREPRLPPEPDERMAQVGEDRGPRDEPAGEAVAPRDLVVVNPVLRVPGKVPGPDPMDRQGVPGYQIDPVLHRATIARPVGARGPGGGSSLDSSWAAG